MDWDKKAVEIAAQKREYDPMGEAGIRCIIRAYETAKLPEPEAGSQPLETAPKGYVRVRFNHILFRVSKARSFSGPVYVSGWMDNDRKPVHEYAYKLIITGWKPLTVIEGEAA